MSKAVTLLNTPNNTTNFYPADDKWELREFPFKASTAAVDGCAIGIEISGNTTTGNVTKMGVENAAGADFVWILAEPIVATDADYATAGKLKKVRVPLSIDSASFFSVWAGTFTAADVFKTVEIHSDSKSLAVDTAGKGARITKHISSSRGECKFVMPNTETA